MRKRPLRRGFTLRELFAVVTIICVLLALLVPLIQASRGRARRIQCKNNLKNICLGLQNYHDTYKMFPMGAMHSGPNPGGDPPVNAALGPSWWYRHRAFYGAAQCGTTALQSTQMPGGPAKHEFCANDMAPVFSRNVRIQDVRTLNALIPDYMRCPSSPLPRHGDSNGPHLLAHLRRHRGRLRHRSPSPKITSRDLSHPRRTVCTTTRRKARGPRPAASSRPAACCLRASMCVCPTAWTAHRTP